MSMGTESRAVAPAAQTRGLVIRDRDDLMWTVQTIHKSGLAPYGMETPERIAIAVMHGLEVGLSPMQAVQSICVINGKPAMYGDAALGLVLASGKLEAHDEGLDGEITSDDHHGWCTVKRSGQKPHTVRFSIGDAKQAELWMKLGKNGKPTPWVNYPQRMLVMRARSWALRDKFADVLKGLGIYEELRDIPATEYTVSTPAAPRGAVHFGFGARQEAAQPSPAEATVDSDDGDADEGEGLDIGDAWEGRSDEQQ